ncbi:hypothetical protein VCRA2119O147_160060 [Vibrio crassostreae]|nr:hypothetical protein VCRA2113O119_10232 [Vibrio crassostreae]CAK1968716.1 hypothetical protein VCRA2110O113_20175 [Vibrio crassostreae]CAK1969140.1 hypothetical protein VCRA2114E122_20175 [Vibrio crassostreae]CAK1971835.1 hypothetical protein VCRA2113O120_20175 [Vibrio crassostreae]CAK2052767.1 hypothetical protein VCRA2117O379_30184 [Vibrio crassostreae]
MESHSITKVSNAAYNAVTIIISYWLVYSAGYLIVSVFIK